MKNHRISVRENEPKQSAATTNSCGSASNATATKGRSMSRIERCFQEKTRTRLLTFITANDPNYQTSLSILKQLPAAGVDCLEVGMPFSDPMADGPAIQASSQRALDGGGSLAQTFALIEEFRRDNLHTPLLLMGYYNPIYQYGRQAFLNEAARIGVDGLIIVDLPLEADDELCLPARERGLDFIRLITPASDDRRVQNLVRNASGFIYYVTITGLTGTTSASRDAIARDVARLRRYTRLPIVAGFGIRSAEQIRALDGVVDGVVVGSALVERIGAAQEESAVIEFVTQLTSEGKRL